MTITDYLKSYINALIRSQFQFPIQLYNTSDEEVWRLGYDSTYGIGIIPNFKVNCTNSNIGGGIVLSGSQVNNAGIFSNSNHEATYGINLSGKYSDSCIYINGTNSRYGIRTDSNTANQIAYYGHAHNEFPVSTSDNPNLRTQIIFKGEGYPQIGCYLNLTNSSTGLQIDSSMIYC